MPRWSKRKAATVANVRKAWEAVMEKKRKKDEKLEKALARLQNLPPPLEDTFQGRRLLASKSILELVGSLTKHGRRCKRGKITIKNEEINGVSSTITFACDRCKWEVSAGSDSGDEKCSLNEALHWATVNIPVSFEATSSLFSCVDLPVAPEWFVKQEPEVDDHTEVALPNDATCKTSQVFGGIRRCLICNKNTLKVRLNVEGVPGNEDAAAFLLGTMLQIPAEKLQEILTNKKAIFWCDSCSVSVQNAFTIQKKLERMTENLGNLKKQFQTSICMSWKLDKGQDSFISKYTDDIMATSVRRYVSTGDWESCEKHDLTAETSFSTVLYKPEVETDMKDHDSDFDLMEHSDIEVDLESESDPRPIACGDTSEHVESEVAMGTPETGDSIRKYSCKMCPDLNPMNVKSFVHHILYHKRRPFQCTVCRHYLTGNSLEFDAQPAKLPTSPIEASLKDHLCTRKTLEKVDFRTLPIWSCEYCSELFDSEEDRDNHEQDCPRKSITIARTHACVTCNSALRNQEEWQIHRALNHPEIARFSCQFCDAIFRLEASKGITDKFVLDVPGLKEHASVCSSKSDPDPHTPAFGQMSHVLRECAFCGKNFDRQLDLEKHLEEHHFISKDSATSCPLCFFRRRTWNDVRSHMRTHIPGSFTCDLCGHSVTREPRLREHCLRVHGVKTEESRLKKCNEEGCTFETFYVSTLTRHQMTTHGVERQHKCQFCGKGFLNLAHKRDHEMIHTNQQSKPYQCEICGNSFALRNYLYIHMRLSHQNRPFASTHKKKPARKKLRKTDKFPQQNIPSPSATRNHSE